MSPVSGLGLTRRRKPLTLRRLITLGAGPMEPPSTGPARYPWWARGAGDDA